MRIEWTAPAVADLEGLKEYIARDSLVYADLTVSQIVGLVERLEEYPRLGKPVPEYRQQNIRQVLYGHYRVIYRITEKQIEVLAVVHAARKNVSRRDTITGSLVGIIREKKAAYGPDEKAKRLAKKHK